MENKVSKLVLGQDDNVLDSFIITQHAASEILRQHAKRAQDGKIAKGLRIGLRGGGCTGFSYVFEWSDEPSRDHDRIFQVKDNIAVFIDPKSFIYLKGTTLDFVRSLMGHGFKFSNPNTKGSCGCGESVQF